MVEEKIVIGENTSFPLNGILTLPKGEGPFSAVVLVHGSGASNMNSKVGKAEPFKDIAEGLAKLGVASIRYDKRSFTYGFKMRKIKDMSVKIETIEDAVFATDILRKHPSIDEEKIYILGLSMGGMLAPRIDAEGGNYAGLIIASGSPRKIEEISESQNEAVIKSAKNPLKWILKKQGAKIAAKYEIMYDLSDQEAKSIKIFGNVNAYYFKEMGEHPAPNYLETLDKPTLILQGEKDFQATVENDFNAYKKLLSHKENVTFKLYEGLNHCLMPYKYDDILKARKEYSRANNVSENVIKDIAEWVLGNSTKK